MKKLLFIAAVSGLSFACNSGSKPSSGTDTTASAAVAPDTSAGATQPAALKDGLMTLKDGKVMIVRSGAWAPLDSTVTCSNGRKVTADGTVSKGDKKRKLEEGMMIDKDGQLMDKNGKPMDTTSWD